MLQAQLSPDEESIICASETNSICLWDVKQVQPSRKETTKKKPTNSNIEFFKAFDETMTCCIVAPPRFAQAVAHAVDLPSSVGGGAHGDTKACRQRECATTGSQGLVMVAGSQKGRLRVFYGASSR
eukprot:Polyplicarium_translucidae@DN1883_c0_g1_i2.p1